LLFPFQSVLIRQYVDVACYSLAQTAFTCVYSSSAS
jgi:hypothetical protein